MQQNTILCADSTPLIREIAETIALVVGFSRVKRLSEVATGDILVTRFPVPGLSQVTRAIFAVGEGSLADLPSVLIGTGREACWLDEAIAFALDYRTLVEPQSLPGEVLRPLIDEFLKTHSTCTLCTGYNQWVRATPLEYLYRDGTFYCLTEGGEKFVGLLHNPVVSLAIYDPYHGPENLNGMQVSGMARLLDPLSPEYAMILAEKELTPEKIEALPVALHVLEVIPQRVEWLCSKFRDRNAAIRQGYRF